ncbi:MAG: NAD-dependent epimerase/dehydratase family protein [Thermoplasmata archaeon]|nr:NAD-dependent epimerase/dehydratase family protein [Thermoplasmata archaeon]
MEIRRDRELFTVPPDTRLRTAVGQLNAAGTRMLLVEENGRLIGVVTDRDIREHLLSGGRMDALVREIMREPAVTLGEDATPEDVARAASEAGERAFPVVDGEGRVVGIIPFSGVEETGRYVEIGDLRRLTASPSTTLEEGMRLIDRTGYGFLLVVTSDAILEGVVTDGDMRRAISRGASLQTPLREVMNPDPISIPDGTPRNVALAIMDERGTDFLPVIDPAQQLTGVYLRGFVPQHGPLPGERMPGVKRILVTGGAGYIGSVLVRQLLEKGYMVRVLDRFLYGDSALSDVRDHPRLEIIEGDTRHIENVTKALDGVDAVIHLGEIVGDPACALRPKLAYETNYLATVSLAAAAKAYQINRFLYASSCSVYGATEKEEFLTENSPLNPVSLYAELKVKSEREILALMDENFSPTILRLSTIYGLSPRPRFDLVVNILTAKAVTEKKITVFGGEQWRPNIHVRDVARAFITVLEAPLEKVRGEIFNVGSDDQNHRIIEIAEMIKKEVPEAVIEVDPEAGDRRNYMVSFRKIQQTLGYLPSETIIGAVREIKEALEKGEIEDYRDERYNNYMKLANSLQERKDDGVG